jgi:hypothetical protein
MKIEIDLNEISYNYMMELAKDYETTPDEIVAGLLIGFALQPMIPKKIKIKKEKNKDEKRKNKLEKSSKK